ncbi:hypothetical protein J2W56_004905 [Nocardia kruczakiae]|uniref:Uncharacterized protein n=1 Tax=Nocardia kruczakiae TaxID=261477 RepID=A0ABU1XM90_9NOCA|nr:hypothetical protein [Nocardia kruczakiae]
MPTRLHYRQEAYCTGCAVRSGAVAR